MVFKKKLYKFNPKKDPRQVETQRTARKSRLERADAQSLERQVRQLLADKVSGNQLGVWMLIPEHLRLGTWDLLSVWTGAHTDQVDSRLALQLVHEAVLCTCSRRRGRSLSQKGFELANGLPFLATDRAIYDLLQARTVNQSQQLQTALGKIRRASGHFPAKVLAIDPHRLYSYTKRQTRRHRFHPGEKPRKMAQTFFCLDADSGLPVCFTLASSARTAAEATPELLELSQAILNPSSKNAKPIVLADVEHNTQSILEYAHQSPFDLLVPMKATKAVRRLAQQLDPARFTKRWAGYATAKIPFQFKNSSTPLWQLIQRSGERPEEYAFKSFLSTSQREEVQQLSDEFPKRWHVEEFFKFNQAMGWDRAGTCNLNIRYGHMTMALIAQAAVGQMRQRLGPPFSNWDADHLQSEFFNKIEGDLRVVDKTIVITYYNAPNAQRLRHHYENLPTILAQEGLPPKIPWLYDYYLDFRFK